MVSLAWSRDLDASVQDALHPIERLLADQRIEVAAPGHAVFGAFDDPDVDRVSQHLAETLRRQHEPPPPFVTCDGIG